jgi:hypothetical protein
MYSKSHKAPGTGRFFFSAASPIGGAVAAATHRAVALRLTGVTADETQAVVQQRHPSDWIARSRMLRDGRGEAMNAVVYGFLQQLLALGVEEEVLNARFLGHLQSLHRAKQNIKDVPRTRLGAEGHQQMAVAYELLAYGDTVPTASHTQHSSLLTSLAVARFAAATNPSKELPFPAPQQPFRLVGQPSPQWFS